MSALAILLSGAAGALVATVAGAGFSFWAERIRVKSEVLLRVVGWSDDSYVRLMDLHMAKHAKYRGDKPYLSAEEYDANTRKLRTRLIEASIEAEVALVYGEGEELALLHKLRERMVSATRALWGATSETWDEVGAEVKESFESEVDPLRHQLERRLLRSASIPILWKEFRSRTMGEVRRRFERILRILGSGPGVSGEGGDT